MRFPQTFEKSSTEFFQHRVGQLDAERPLQGFMAQRRLQTLCIWAQVNTSAGCFMPAVQPQLATRLQSDALQLRGRLGLMAAATGSHGRRHCFNPY